MQLDSQLSSLPAATAACIHTHAHVFFSPELARNSSSIVGPGNVLGTETKKEQDAAVNERTNRHDELVKPDLLHMYTNHYFNNHVEKQQIRHDRPQIYVRTH